MRQTCGMILLVAALFVAFAIASSAQSISWTMGSRVHANNIVCARADTLTTLCGTLRTTGDKGTVLGGPAGNVKFGRSWFIHYDKPPDGWSTELYLTVDTLAPPVKPPQPPTFNLQRGFSCTWSANIGAPCKPGTYGPWPAYNDSTGAIVGDYSVTFTARP